MGWLVREENVGVIEGEIDFVRVWVIIDVEGGVFGFGEEKNLGLGIGFCFEIFKIYILYI